jgi:hypothetical protein
MSDPTAIELEAYARVSLNAAYTPCGTYTAIIGFLPTLMPDAIENEIRCVLGGFPELVCHGCRLYWWSVMS